MPCKTYKHKFNKSNFNNKKSIKRNKRTSYSKKLYSNIKQNGSSNTDIDTISSIITKSEYYKLFYNKLINKELIIDLYSNSETITYNALYILALIKLIVFQWQQIEQKGNILRCFVNFNTNIGKTEFDKLYIEINKTSNKTKLEINKTSDEILEFIINILYSQFYKLIKTDNDLIFNLCYKVMAYYIIYGNNFLYNLVTQNILQNSFTTDCFNDNFCNVIHNYIIKDAFDNKDTAIKPIYKAFNIYLNFLSKNNPILVMIFTLLLTDNDYLFDNTQNILEIDNEIIDIILEHINNINKLNNETDETDETDESLQYTILEESFHNTVNGKNIIITDDNYNNLNSSNQLFFKENLFYTKKNIYFKKTIYFKKIINKDNLPLLINKIFDYNINKYIDIINSSTNTRVLEGNDRFENVNLIKEIKTIYAILDVLLKNKQSKKTTLKITSCKKNLIIAMKKFDILYNSMIKVEKNILPKTTSNSVNDPPITRRTFLWKKHITPGEPPSYSLGLLPYSTDV